MADSSSSVSNEGQYQFKYKGVRKRKWGKYVCEIRLPNSRERIWLGSYDTAEKAARAFDAALFCLRGRNANFNFPDDPPNIIGGHLLTPTEIQAVAQQYGNQYSCSSSNQPPPRPLSNVGDVEFRAQSMNSIDWSFLDTLDSNVNGGNTASVVDFGLFAEPGDVYMPPQFESTGIDNGNGNHDDGDHENSGNIASNFLWNF